MKYKIEFHDYWCLTSGLSGGAQADTVCLRNNDGFPYVPGKTIKGLLREAATILRDAGSAKHALCIEEVFGKESHATESEAIGGSGKAYFGNATLAAKTAKEIFSNELQNELFDLIAATAIDGANGLAKPGSLRRTEVAIPITLYGEIENLPTEHEAAMKECLKYVRRMGLLRSRGLGRCTFTVIN